MNLLLDTHALAWWLLKDSRLSQKIYDLISDPECNVWVSTVSAFEMATKFRIGKWPGIADFLNSFDATMRVEQFVVWPINTAHALQAGLLPGAHRDPFYRLLAAQSLVEGVPLVTNDQKFKAFGVETIW